MSTRRNQLVNGLLRSDLSDMDALPKGLSVSPLATAMGSDAGRLKDVLGQINAGHPMPMLALNAAYLNDGLVIDIDADTDVEMPVHIVSIGIGAAQPIAFHPRNLIFAGSNSQATVYESHIGLGDTYLNNGVTEIEWPKGRCCGTVNCRTRPKAPITLLRPPFPRRSRAI